MVCVCARVCVHGCMHVCACVCAWHGVVHCASHCVCAYPGMLKSLMTACVLHIHTKFIFCVHLSFLPFPLMPVHCEFSL